MSETTIPDEVCRFILTSIPSVPHLEALLLLRSEPSKSWQAGSVARRLYISERTAIQVLDDLKGADFLVVDPANAAAYRYAASSAQSDLVDRVAEAYSHNLIEVTNLIHRRPATRLQEFADAFRIRKE